MKTKSISLHSWLKSFRFAFTGIYQFFQQEPNARLHLVATVLVLGVACYFRVSNAEKIALVIVTGCVWVAEAFNTVIERIMDLISPERRPEVAFIKDLSAGAVLLSALMALTTGAIVFIPKFF